MMLVLRQITVAAALTLAALPATAQTLSPPPATEPIVIEQATSSVGSTEILITVLATLLIWAAYDQNARAN